MNLAVVNNIVIMAVSIDTAQPTIMWYSTLFNWQTNDGRGLADPYNQFVTYI